MSEAEEEDSQAQAERPVARSFDSLVKPAVPSRCASEDMESFCPAGHWHGQPDGRYFAVDPDNFHQTSFIRWDAHT